MCVKVKAALLPLGNQAWAVVGTSEQLPGTQATWLPATQIGLENPQRSGKGTRHSKMAQ